MELDKQVWWHVGNRRADAGNSYPNFFLPEFSENIYR